MTNFSIFKQGKGVGHNRRIDVNVGVAYGTDPKRVIDLLVEVARSTPGVAALPEPLVLFTGFGASSLDFVVRCWTDDYGESVAIRSNLAVRVHDALMAARIEIPFPQQDLHLRSVSPEARPVLEGRATGPGPGRLKGAHSAADPAARATGCT